MLQDTGIGAALPSYLTHLPLPDCAEAFDGPGIVTTIRNALVHATEHKREILKSVDGLCLYECSQIAVQYVELVLLRVCGYRGHYARRRWEGWKAEGEVLVPWAGE